MKIKELKDIVKISQQLKKKKKKIILCHGDFDNFHYGHLKYFESAKKFGDILVVSLTSDKYINKGLNRPIFNEKQRAEIISSLKIVDYVYVDNNLTAEKIISNLKPDYFVKGSDYKDSKKDLSGNIIKEKKLVEKKGGKLVFTDEEVFSSSKIINHSGMNKDLLKSLINIKKKYDINEIIKGDSIFCATGITSGDLINGVKKDGFYFNTETLITHKNQNLVRIIRKKYSFE